MAGRAPRIGQLPAPRHGGSRGRFAVVAGRFNEPVSKKLVDGAVGALAAHGVTGADVEVHWVPGSFELGQAAHALAVTRRFAAIVCVGAVIKGATPHFDYVCGAAAQGITHAALATGVPPHEVVEYDPKELVSRFRNFAEKAVVEGRISPKERREILDIYRTGLGGYTYFES